MARRRKHYSENGVFYIKCNECWEYKEATLNNRYRAQKWFMWFDNKCKECRGKYSNPENTRKRRNKNKEEETRKLETKEGWIKTHCI